ncbi:MarR family winged helix-turn-helix transcriptional regulator [Lactobacillus kefiranofaciens]|uniref:MarR family winged helix-turn-helix transcriptional regulator n=1 Tax=Lactobacillus kefiranofaciens TaxID=267818 RepID=UPI002469ABB9|nr:MarR family winged helix-turn-helix transcriptional regulator [Lactobacillus kefiranofaciens]MDH5099575.1 MarR family winged helix-turn-helix transcriptional regulator [Lactobacillus kefiranofaciens]
MDVLFFSTIADQIKKEINHKCGLNISQTRILLFFDQNDNRALTMGKLAGALNISLSTLSRQLQQKKTKTFIKIIRSEKDSSKIVKLSSEGLNKASELKKALNQIERSLFVYLDQDASALFIKQLEKIAHSSTSERM